LWGVRNRKGRENSQVVSEVIVSSVNLGRVARKKREAEKKGHFSEERFEGGAGKKATLELKSLEFSRKVVENVQDILGPGKKKE